ncbi:MAG: sigma 54-interacting transcriptional regulator [Desulfobacterales bacterium]|nr:sigma 54-interacting transcriptional regulator [Desulfobacterales bacterium]
MKRSDMDFFHHATTKISGSLDIGTVLERCLGFFKGYMPLDSIGMNIFNPTTRSTVNIATAGPSGFRPVEKPIPLSDDACRLIEADKGGTVEIINRPEKDLVARSFWEAMGKQQMSSLVLKLRIEDQKLGVVIFLAKGADRYTPEHARLLNLIHDPFAMALANALKHQEVLRLKDLLVDDNQFLNRQLHQISGDEIIGSEFGLKHVMDRVRQIAPRTNQVLLLGETGVGKEVIANAIHYSSPRAGGPFIKVNCGAIPESLIDSELFGHEKGAFTGAVTRKRGRFERADKGTLFLDEIGELPLSAQVRLLRVLQNKEIERVGGSHPIPVDIRIITATHRDLPQMVRQGRFREDLWFRINVFPITIPPLRRRKSDIPALITYFSEKKSSEMNLQTPPVISPDTVEKFQAYHWPGNVRELENIVERTIIQSITGSPDNPTEFETVFPEIENHDNRSEKEVAANQMRLDDVIRSHIERVLRMTRGRVQGENGAAARLGVNPSTLRNRMKKLGISYGRNHGIKQRG